MTKGVAGGALLDLRRVGGLLDGPLHRRVGAVVAADGPAPQIFRERRGRKDVLPPPLGRGVRVFFLDRVGQVDPAHALGTVLFVLGLSLLQVAPERGVEALGEHGRPVLPPLSVPHVNASMREAELLDPHPEGLRDSDRRRPLPYKR